MSLIDILCVIWIILFIVRVRMLDEMKMFGDGYSAKTGIKWKRFPYNEFEFGPIHFKRYVAGKDEFISIFTDFEN